MPTTEPDFGLRTGSSGVHNSRTMMLEDLTKVMELMAHDSQFDLGTEVVENNILGKKTSVSSQHTIASVAVDSFRSVGFLPEQMPVLEEASDGTSAITLRRQLWMVHIEVPFQRLLEWMGILFPATSPYRRDSMAPVEFELQPMISPIGLFEQLDHFAFFDETHSRRAYYSFEGFQAAVAAATDAGPGAAKQVINDLEALSQKQSARLGSGGGR